MTIGLRIGNTNVRQNELANRAVAITSICGRRNGQQRRAGHGMCMKVRYDLKRMGYDRRRQSTRTCRAGNRSSLGPSHFVLSRHLQHNLRAELGMIPAWRCRTLLPKSGRWLPARFGCQTHSTEHRRGSKDLRTKIRAPRIWRPGRGHRQAIMRYMAWLEEVGCHVQLSAQPCCG